MRTKTLSLLFIILALSLTNISTQACDFGDKACTDAQTTTEIASNAADPEITEGKANNSSFLLWIIILCFVVGGGSAVQKSVETAKLNAHFDEISSTPLTYENEEEFLLEEVAELNAYIIESEATLAGKNSKVAIQRYVKELSKEVAKLITGHTSGAAMISTDGMDFLIHTIFELSGVQKQKFVRDAILNGMRQAKGVKVKITLDKDVVKEGVYSWIDSNVNSPEKLLGYILQSMKTQPTPEVGEASYIAEFKIDVERIFESGQKITYQLLADIIPFFDFAIMTHAYDYDALYSALAVNKLTKAAAVAALITAQEMMVGSHNQKMEDHIENYLAGLQF